jgi:peptide methionine sulfoxide reductase msrA/msrB
VKKLVFGTVLAAATAVAVIADTDGDKDREQVMSDDRLAVATFAGGCFWCVESDFEQVPGVVEAVSGYTGGSTREPSYGQVSSGSTGHLESVQVYYDPAIISYEGLLAAFWRMINPTDAHGQFVDRGKQYSTAIFCHDAEQRLAAEKSRDALAASRRHASPIVTPILEATEFHVAEEYHQDYYRKNPIRYKLYRYGSGRDQYLEKAWGSDLQVNFGKFVPGES